MSKREVYKRAYLKGIRDILGFIGIIGLFTTMIVLSLLK